MASLLLGVEREENMLDKVSRTLCILSIASIVCGFILRVVIPETLFLPFGRPFGSHYVRAGWLGFWVFLVVGLLAGAAMFLRLTIRKLTSAP